MKLWQKKSWKCSSTFFVGGPLFLCLGCVQWKGKEKVSLPIERQLHIYDNMNTLFPDPPNFMGKGPHVSEKSSALWYGALKALARFPLEIFNPERGFLQTQWYIPENLPDHRLQVKVCIVSSVEIRVEGLSVTVLHQVLKQGQWILIPTSLELEQKIKRSILLHARNYVVQSK
ncbi:DUF3576 domain-containing protein [Holospora curviuscula]|uniref:Uncharacterized protein n=1 Tax=Holospora curviuscula TaxID=1082868 RepID=A0A2S5R9A3_9PROT|nr:DUF3576 domain-containing protein [Holospora curviuscula]PPE03906.1 hypothetical protein HCUR_00686 [Holospora curviuscula]